MRLTFIDNFIQLFKNKNTQTQFRRYLITGFTSFGIEYSMFGLLIFMFDYFQFHWYQFLFFQFSNLVSEFSNTNLSEISYRSLISNFIVFNIVFWLNYLLNRFWSFKSTKPLGKQIFQYSLLFLFNLLIGNILLLYLLTNWFHIHPMFAKIIIMGCVVSWNFIVYRMVIYKD